MYEDERRKIEYYKNRIMRQLSEQGVYQDADEIRARVRQISSRLAIFRFSEAVPGTSFDTTQANLHFESIHEDLRLIYKLIEHKVVDGLAELKAYVECHLAELEEAARKYKLKAQIETAATALGKTVFLQTSGFQPRRKDGRLIYDLGKLTTRVGSQLYCLLDAEEIALENVIFTFDGVNCSPYRFNRDIFKVPGAPATKWYDFALPKNQRVTSSFFVNIADFKPKADNGYRIYGGADCFSFLDRRSVLSVHPKRQGEAWSMKNSGRIEFWIYKGSFVQFDFSRSPLQKNFTGNAIEGLRDSHKIVIEAEAGFVFDFTTDGQVYAVKKVGSIVKEKLCCPAVSGVFDFVIEEILPGANCVIKDVKMQLVDQTSVPKINYIAVKELAATEAVNAV